MRGESTGMALPLVLVLLIALSFFGHAALVLSQREVQASAAFRDLARAEKAAGVALRIALSLPVDPMGERPPWLPQSLVAGEVMGGLTYSATRYWIDGEFFVVLGRGGVKGWPGRKEVGWLGWVLHPGIRLSSFSAAAEVGAGVSFHEKSSVSIDGFFSAPEGWPPEAGAELGRRARGIYGGGPLPAVARSVTPPSNSEGNPIGSFGASSQGARRIPGLGPLSGAEILRRVGKSDGFGPRKSEQAGYGCPGSGEMPVSLGAPGPLSLPAGRSCGLVVTAGDLNVGAGVLFQGLALVAGDLVIESTGILEGLARIGGRLILREGAEFRGASIPAVWALEGAQGLHTPLPVPLDWTWVW